MGKLMACGKSDIGVVRNTNQDSVLVRKFGDIYLLAVADGLGGQPAGDIASKMAVIELEETVKANIGKVPEKEILMQAVVKANREIYLLSNENPEYKGMGTTLVAAILFGDGAVVANVGDSRAYLIGDGIRQITQDHSLVQEMSENGNNDRENASPQKNIVTRVLGVAAESKPDFFELKLEGKTLLLCSDGLTNTLSDLEIQQIVNAQPGIDAVCDRLLATTNEKGSKDNVTVILAKETK
jgi:PPM family protein phosphatase